MKRFILVLAILLVTQLTFAASDTTTATFMVGVGKDFTTLGAAFTAISNNGYADSVTLLLTDTVYNESELVLRPHTNYPRVVYATPWQNQGTTNKIINICAEEYFTNLIHFIKYFSVTAIFK